MQPPSDPTTTFVYQAQAIDDGQPLSGTIEAADIEKATARLVALRLRVLTIEPTGKRDKPRPLKGDDFIAFNQQLGYLTAAGLPIEHGLRLIAEEMRRGRLKQTVQMIADELEQGTPLAQAFEKHQTHFPSLYGRLIEAGVKSNNLPGMLFNLNRHMDLLRRMRALLWQSASYPLMVMAGLVFVMAFLGMYVIPKFDQLFRDFKVALPDVTVALLYLSHAMPAIVITLAVLIVAAPLIGVLLRMTGLDGPMRDRVLLPMPLLGPVFRKSLLAGWCNAMKVGVDGGLDLPAAIRLAGDSSTSPALQRDSEKLVTHLEAGQSLDTMERGSVLPPTVMAGMALGIANHDLATTLGSLSEMYQQQAEMRLGLVPAFLSPMLILLMGGAIGFVVVGLMMPMMVLIGAVSGSGK